MEFGGNVRLSAPGPMLKSPMEYKELGLFKAVWLVESEWGLWRRKVVGSGSGER